MLRKSIFTTFDKSNIELAKFLKDVIYYSFISDTGSNTGIGKVTAHEISKKGARVILLCRNIDKAESAASEISNDTGNPVDVIKLDLSSLTSVRECAQILLEKEEQIDILINNAGNILNWWKYKYINNCVTITICVLEYIDD